MNHPTVRPLIQRTQKLPFRLNAFCKEFGLSYSVITKIIYGIRPNPTVGTLSKWSAALDKAERRAQRIAKAIKSTR